MSTTVCLALSTIGSMEQAQAIARTVVEAKLAACVNLVPQVQSVYEWQGKLCEEAEVLMIFKTSEEKYPELERKIREIHPYELPEIFHIPVSGGWPPYLDWITLQVFHSQA